MSIEKKRRAIKMGVILIGLLVVFSVVRYSQATKLNKKNAAMELAPGTPTTPTETAPTTAPLFLVEKKPFSDSIPGLVGTIKGNTIELTFNGQEERLTASRVDMGQRVKSGQILFELDHTRANARKSQAESALIRAKELLEAGGATSYDVGDAQAAFDLANKDYQDTFIYAPVNGTVSQINKQVGETVGRSDIMAVLVASEGRLVLETGVVESQLQLVTEGQQARIDIEAFPGHQIEGKVLGVAREVTTTGRTGMVLIGIPISIQKNLRPGLSARCEIITYNVPSLVIPRQAYDAEKKTVIVVGKDGKAVVTPVVIGHVTREYYEVVKGLSEGDTIVSDLVTHSIEPGTMIASAGDLEHYQPDNAKTTQEN
jgi:RND family efflux transporter MFP subunit